MEAVHLLRLGFDKLGWLSARQAVIGQNVANANLPGYAARDVEPFSAEYARTRMALATTDSRHMRLDGDGGGAQVKDADSAGWGVTLSGNAVSLEEQMMRQSEVATDQSLVATTLRSFQKMLMTSVRG